jgi:hypothetical protein
LADKRKTDLMSVEGSGLDERASYGTVSSMLNQVAITARYGKRDKTFDPKDHYDGMMNPSRRFQTPSRQELTTQ